MPKQQKKIGYCCNMLQRSAEWGSKIITRSRDEPKKLTMAVSSKRRNTQLKRREELHCIHCIRNKSSFIHSYHFAVQKRHVGRRTQARQVVKDEPTEESAISITISTVATASLSRSFSFSFCCNVQVKSFLHQHRDLGIAFFTKPCCVNGRIPSWHKNGKRLTAPRQAVNNE